ncbi:hypothetical protein HCN44_005799 [Aphidius gifuensis]|uniref:Heparanase n=1 Tax=Aphidius gifuensis TaxID=684658 RepID=A0A835CT82_APHGI|nr:hypothetical protein HCN44_005799 [Aphidius gifuensis]
MLHKTSTRFLSFSLDSSHLRDPEKLPINNEAFVNLAKHLSPAYLRIGGTSADCIFFKQNSADIFKAKDITNFILTEELYLSLYKFTEKIEAKMLFDLNVLIRTEKNEWNSSNAKDIIEFSKNHGMDIDWQLGNEPNSFKFVFNQSISATQLAHDYQHLRNLLNDIGYSSSKLVGPETNHIGESNERGEMYTEEFLKNQDNSIDFVTWHQYYLHGKTAKVDDFINPKVFNQLSSQIKQINNATKNSATGGGVANLSNRFAATFLWLDKLGYSASAGVDVVIRQTLLGGNYSLVGNDLLPNPDWWISVLYKRFVSEIVLDLKTPNNFGTLRFYAHCTAKLGLVNRLPALTVYGMNLDHKSKNIFIQGNWIQKKTNIFLYILTADDLTSREIKLNGEKLKLNSDGSLPPFNPVIIKPTQMINIPPLSIAFIVIHGADIPSCIP